jgi:sigma-54 specific flagellar transcriptional regulator A
LYPGEEVSYEKLPPRYQIELTSEMQLIPPVEEESVGKASQIDTTSQQKVIEPVSTQDDEDLISSSEGGSATFSGSESFDLENGLDLKSYLVQMEVSLIKQALSATQNNVSRAAKLLKMNRTTLVEKIKKYGLS